MPEWPGNPFIQPAFLSPFTYRHENCIIKIILLNLLKNPAATIRADKTAGSIM
jgi:hypothetical protein